MWLRCMSSGQVGLALLKVRMNHMAPIPAEGASFLLQLSDYLHQQPSETQMIQVRRAVALIHQLISCILWGVLLLLLPSPHI